MKNLSSLVCPLGRGQVKKPRNKKPEVTRSRVSAGGDDREDDEESNKSNRSGKDLGYLLIYDFLHRPRTF